MGIISTKLLKYMHVAISVIYDRVAYGYIDTVMHVMPMVVICLSSVAGGLYMPIPEKQH